MKVLLGWLILIFISGVVFTYRLPLNPPGFFADEAIYGYEAYSLLTTGLSSNGEFFPRFIQNPGMTARSHTFYAYLIVPWIKLLGLTETAVRLTSITFSLLTLSLLYALLVRHLSFSSALITLALWSFSGWTYLISRDGVELILCPFFSVLFLAAFSNIARRVKPSYIHTAALSMSLVGLHYSYSAGKLLSVALLFVAFIYALIKKWGFTRTTLLILVFISGLLLSLPYIRDGSYFYRSSELKTCSPSSWACFKTNIISHFLPESYFGNSYTPKDFPVPRHSITGTSLVPRVLAPLLFIGLLALLYRLAKREVFWLVTLCFIFFSAIPASLTLRGFDSYRSVSLLPLVFTVSGLGLYSLLQIIKVQLGKSILIIATGIVLLLILSSAQKELPVLLSYELNTAAASYSGFQYGYRQIFDYVKSVYSQYDHVFITSDIAYVPELHIRFFDPEKKYPNISLYYSHEQLRHLSGNFLIIVPARNFPPGFVVLKTIRYPNGIDPAFYIGVFTGSADY